MRTRGTSPACTRVHKFSPVRRCGRLSNVLSRTTARISTFGEALQTLIVEAESLALHIGSSRSARAGPLIPIKTEPFHVAIDGLGRPGTIPDRVDVFDPQDKTTAEGPHLEPTEQQGLCVAKMQRTCGAGRKTTSHDPRAALTGWLPFPSNRHWGRIRGVGSSNQGRR